MKSRILFRGIIILFSVFYLTPLFAQTENKVAVITVSGSGKTQDEAKQNALRNAIEQAFGTFISSNTQILNDELVKDEIVSVSSGNIQEYTVLSEVQTPDGYWTKTVKAKVAIDKLTSFCESKGVNVEFNGSLFALNIKQQMLNEQNELKSIENMRIVLKEILNQSFNYVISTSQPTSFGGSWRIHVIVEGTLNNNFINVSNYLFNTLKGVSCTQSEVDNYISLEKELYFIAFKPFGAKDKDAGLFALRNEKSFVELISLIDDLKEAFFNFSINNGVENINMNSLEVHGRDNIYFESKYESIHRINVESIEFRPVLTKWDIGINSSNHSEFLSRNFKYHYYPPLRDKQLSYDPTNTSNYRWFETYINKYFKFIKDWDFLYDYNGEEYIAISFSNLVIGKTKGILSFDNIYSVEQIQRISEYKIAPNSKLY